MVNMKKDVSSLFLVSVSFVFISLNSCSTSPEKESDKEVYTKEESAQVLADKNDSLFKAGKKLYNGGNHKKAVELWFQAAEHGREDAKYNLAVCYYLAVNSYK